MDSSLQIFKTEITREKIIMFVALSYYNKTALFDGKGIIYATFIVNF